MSAMHWEARRRQSALDRKTVKHKQQLLSEDPEATATESKPTQEQTAVDQCPHCKNDLKTPVQSGKIPNRYSSLQYKQQW